MSCVRRMSIDTLSPDVDNAMVIGVIIAKQSAKRVVFPSDGLERGVWNFTVRDSPNDTINVTWWGTMDRVSGLCNCFTIGDVVQVINPRIKFVPHGDNSASFRPVVSSPFTLELQEHRNNEMLPHMEPDVSVIQSLVRTPMKADGNFLRLSDVCGRGKSMQGRSVNLLVAVTSIGTVRTVVTRKNNENVPCRNLVVMDETERDFQITLWDLDILHLADDWKPQETVLLLADVVIRYDEFKQVITVNLNSRSVVTVDPDMPEAVKLRDYVASVPLGSRALLDQMSDEFRSGQGNLSDPVMTTAQVMDKAKNCEIANGQFSALLYAHVTRYDLDGAGQIFILKCSNCGAVLDDSVACTANECLGLMTVPTPAFSIHMDITDHRGSLTGCRLTGTRAAGVMGCTEDAFMGLSLEERTELKWRILLQRCAVQILVLCPNRTRTQPLISVISCEPADMATVSAKLPFY